MQFDSDLAAKLDGKTKPVGSLGRIEAVAARVARAQGRLDPVMKSCRLVIFAADHGIADEGVSAFPAEVTRQMVLNFASGGAASNVFARENGLDMSVVNAGVRGGAFNLPGVHEAAIAEGTKSFLHGPAMEAEQLYRAIQAGKQIGAEGDWNAIALGEMGIGNTSAAALIAHRLTGAPLSDLVGRGTGISGEGLIHKHDVLRRSSARVAETLGPERVLAEFGGFEIAMMTGAMLGAVSVGRVILVDGFIATSAALAAAAMDANVRDHLVFSHVSAEPGHRVMLESLGALPLLQLDLRLGEGTGAALAWPLVKSAVAMLNDMASFAEAGVSGQER